MRAQVLSAIATVLSLENYLRDIDSYNRGAFRSGFPAGVDKCYTASRRVIFCRETALLFKKTSLPIRSI